MLQFIFNTAYLQTPWQVGSQDPATPIIFGIIHFHNHLLFFLAVASILFVNYFIYKTSKRTLTLSFGLNVLLTFGFCLVIFFKGHLVLFYLTLGGFFFNYYTKAFKSLRFCQNSNPKSKLDNLGYYSAYLFIEECKIIYSIPLNTGRFNNFFFKFFGISFCVYSFISDHLKFCFFILWFPLLAFPQFILQVAVVLLFFGVFLFFLSLNNAWTTNYNLVFQGKTYLRFNCKTQRWLINFVHILCLSCILACLLNLNLKDFADLLVVFLCEINIFLLYRTVDTGFVHFSLLSFVEFIGCCYLVYISFIYSSKTWLVRYNAGHFLLYIGWIIFISPQALASYVNMNLALVLVLTGLYVVFWLVCLVFSVRIYFGTWDLVKVYFKTDTKTKAMIKKPLNITEALKSVHEARLLHCVCDNYNVHHYNYIMAIVIIYALVGWALNKIPRLNYLLFGVCALFRCIPEFGPDIFLFNCVFFFLCFALHSLSCDDLWYLNFKKANGPPFLSLLI